MKLKTLIPSLVVLLTLSAFTNAKQNTETMEKSAQNILATRITRTVYFPDSTTQYVDIHAFINKTRQLSYVAALDKAKKEKKPLLIYFTTKNSELCQNINNNILANASIYKVISKDFVFLPLFVDDYKQLPQDQVSESKWTGKMIRTIGDKNLELQMDKFNTNTQPLFVIVDGSENIIGMTGYQQDQAIFLKYLYDGYKKYMKVSGH